jgi:subtilase family serine protease
MNVSTKSMQLATAIIALSSSIPAFAQPISAILRLKEKVPLESLAQNVKALADTHGFYTPEDIRELSGPSDAEYNQLLSQLRAEGFTVTRESPTHLWISISGDHTAFEKTFGTKVTFIDEKHHTGVAPAYRPMRYSLIASISGLDNTRMSRSHIAYVSPLKGKKKPTPQDNNPGGGISLDTIKQAYGFTSIYASGNSAAGQDIAVATYDGFMIDDVNQFYSQIGIAPTPKVDQVSFNGTATYNEDSAMETQLDAEFTGMMAPGANIHVFASATNDDAGELQMFTAILDDNRSKVVNYSWGGCETQLAAQHASDMDKVFARAVAQGVNILVASGDSGSDSCQDNTTAADWPGAHPDVTAVGGTTLTQSGDSFTETAWSGSGGGISSMWALPSYQSGLGSPYVKRSYPDVAFNADPNSGEAVYIHQNGTAGWAVIGGTSMAAPQWSGFLTMVNAARVAAGKTAIGQLNPILYGISASDRASMFNDITSGSNGAYTAGPGWDAVTGWGTPQAGNLYNYLVNN